MTDNMKLWKAVEKTNPAYTKKVNQRGGFTSISANYQIMEATEQFGPIGIGWGYMSGDPIICDTLVMVPVTLWHGSRENTFGPMIGCDEWKDKDGRVDSDAPKKATTDAITKMLSQLGFNADVFLGRFDDVKYVAQMEREFAANREPDEVPNHILDVLAEIETQNTQAALKAIWERESATVNDQGHQSMISEAINKRISQFKKRAA